MTEVPVKYICPANQWTDFYMIGNSIMKGLKESSRIQESIPKNFVKLSQFLKIYEIISF